MSCVAGLQVTGQQCLKHIATLTDIATSSRSAVHQQMLDEAQWVLGAQQFVWKGKGRQALKLTRHRRHVEASWTCGLCKKVYEWFHLCAWGCEVCIDPHKASQALLQSRAEGSQGLMKTLGLVYLQRAALLVQVPHCLGICHLQA